VVPQPKAIIGAGEAMMVACLGGHGDLKISCLGHL